MRARPATELPAFARFCAALRLEQGTPLVLEPFQRTMLRDYFEGVRETLILLSKKNGKTTILAALALWHLIRTWDAECVIGASSRDQATILYDQAAGFVRRSPGLQARLLVRRGYREIRTRRPGDSGRVRVLAADVDTADGIIPTLALMDELHRQASAGLYGIFRDGLGPRRGQMLAISVAGEHELSPLGEMRSAARRLPGVKRRGRYLHVRSQDGGFVMHEWALEPDDDWHDMRVVKKVNPASWQTEELLRERHDSPSMLEWQWQRFACGLWVSAEHRWMDPEQWYAGASEERLQRGDRIALGFDGSRLDDATALVACRLEDGLLQPLAVWEAPRDERGRRLEEWEVPRGEVDAAVAAAHEDYRVVRGYYDPPLWQTEIDTWAREFGEEAVLRFATNRRRMMSATERFRTDVASGEVPYADEDGTLTAHVLNAHISKARGGYWLAKARPGSPEKIDAAVAAVLAYEARADVVAGEREEPSRELLVF